MIKKVSYTYSGMNQDIIKDKTPVQFYYKGNNIRLTLNDSQTQGGVNNEKGNTLIITIPSPIIDTVNKTITYNSTVINYKNDELNTQISDNLLNSNSGTQEIIGYTLTKNGMILFTTDGSGFDCIWEVDELLETTFNISLLYCRFLNFSTSNPIQALFNYENEKIQKIYWIDGNEQLKFINIKQSIVNEDLEELIDLKSNAINMVGEFDLSQPIVESIESGGIHTAGVIQYAYNLYRLNGAQTIISPLSKQVDLDKGIALGGGNLNEVVGTAPVVSISNIDANFTHIKIYAIKYTSLNTSPSVSLINDSEIESYTEMIYFDDGNIISSLSIEEFTFLGSSLIIPKHITVKDNSLFAANLTEKNYDLDIDTRAYSFNNTGSCKVYTINNAYTSIIPGIFDLDKKHDAINKDYSTYKYQSNGSVLGGEGKYIKYTIHQKKEYELSGNLKYLRFFKDNEVYRIGIQFYNKLGQITPVKWIGDFRAPIGNLNGDYSVLSVHLKSDIYTYINSLNLSKYEIPIGYRIVRADRTPNDRSILCQGPLTGMIVQTTKEPRNDDFWTVESNRIEESKSKIKIPTPVLRTFKQQIYPVEVYNNYDLVDSHEVHTDYKGDRERQTTWQYTKLMQMYSPEILFNTGLTFGNGLKLNIKGLVQKDSIDMWNKKIDTVTQNEMNSYKTNITTDYMDGYDWESWGIIAPAKNQKGSSGGTENTDMNFTSIRHSFKNYIPSNYEAIIFGQPEITERGQSTSSYNKNSEFQYTNTLENTITDLRHKRHSYTEDDPMITGVNTYGARCLTLVQGSDTSSESNRKSLEDLYSLAGFTSEEGLLIGEIKRDDNYIYEGNIYGGNSYEDKSRTNYIEIGDYLDINTDTSYIESPGDTFVQTFRFARFSKTDTEVFNIGKMQLTEIVEVPMETSINLDNRSDLSGYGWDNKFQPKYDEFHDYNRVYSQSATLLQRNSNSFKFKKVNEFANKIISTKVKLAGEFVDNWTDFQENEVIELDGKYGSINSLINSNDEVYALQNTGVAHITINPRVQTKGSDGVGLELGIGTKLYDYQYLSTTSGTINKWSVFKSPTGFYYFDIQNKLIGKVEGQKLQYLSIAKGMNSFLKNNIDYNILKDDNPLLKRGITGIYDLNNNTAMFTVLQGSNSFTLSYDERYQSFVSFYDYTPSIYVSKGFRFLSLHPDNNKIYKHFEESNYNSFYGTLYPSEITLQIHTPENDAIFNNITYRGEMYLDGIDLPKETITQIQGWNEYQQSFLTDLVYGKNISRKFRIWKANIPRATLNGNPSLNRLRGQWIKLLLKFENPNNYKLVLHDTTIIYSAYAN